MADAPASEPPPSDGLETERQLDDFYRGNHAVATSDEPKIADVDSTQFSETGRVMPNVVLTGGIFVGFLASVFIGHLIGGSSTGLATGIVGGFVTFATLVWAMNPELR